jgi:hypothetical protein
MNFKLVGRVVRGIRDRIPGGYLIGRLSSGTGAPEIISLGEIVQAIQANAQEGGGSGIVSEVDTGLGLTGGPITTKGTVAGVPTSSTAFGVCKVDGTTITAVDGVISALGGATGANPTATAGPSAIDGSATTFMRSDAAPAVQIASTSQLGLAQADGTTIHVTDGVFSVYSPNPSLQGWIPLSLGVEPAQIVTDGAGDFVLTAPGV